MNSLNILSSRVIGQTPPSLSEKPPRPRSLSESGRGKEREVFQPRRSASQHENAGFLVPAGRKVVPAVSHDAVKPEDEDNPEFPNEKSPLLPDERPVLKAGSKQSRLHLVAKRLVDALTKSLKWVLSTLAAPGVYVLTCFYNEEGNFSPLLPIHKMRGKLPRRSGSNSTAHAVGLSGSSDCPIRSGEVDSDKRPLHSRPSVESKKRNARIVDSGASSATSDSDIDSRESENGKTRSSESKPKPDASPSLDENTPTRRSIRIKLKHEDSTRLRKQKKNQEQGTKPAQTQRPALTAANLKSPTSPASSLRMTKYPRAPAPPRPLIPRRQPSYSAHNSHRPSHLAQKTLVIDLDETLIHSLAKGGRMSSGHMVEVKLNTTVGLNGATLGPQHPILYYVHKRPHCDDFLRKVCKWYNLVVFTASVQEYADPVIDWLEQERKYFSARYYRQHCTFRNGAYIKDLSSVEPDLSKVMILDNSPLSYIFHEG